jgi:hypothetical protein
MISAAEQICALHVIQHLYIGIWYKSVCACDQDVCAQALLYRTLHLRPVHINQDAVTLKSTVDIAVRMHIYGNLSHKPTS